MIRRATSTEDDSLLEEDETANISKKCYFTEAEQDDEDLQELSKLLNNYNADSSYTRREIARLLSKRLLKNALIAGAETDNVAIILLLKGFEVEEHKI